MHKATKYQVTSLLTVVHARDILQQVPAGLADDGGNKKHFGRCIRASEY